MLQGISWIDFVAVLLPLVVGYYAVYAYLFYREEIRHFFGQGSGRTKAPGSPATPEKQPGDPDPTNTLPTHINPYANTLSDREGPAVNAQRRTPVANPLPGAVYHTTEEETAEEETAEIAEEQKGQKEPEQQKEPEKHKKPIPGRRDESLNPIPTAPSVFSEKEPEGPGPGGKRRLTGFSFQDPVSGVGTREDAKENDKNADPLAALRQDFEKDAGRKSPFLTQTIQAPESEGPENEKDEKIKRLHIVRRLREEIEAPAPFRYPEEEQGPLSIDFSSYKDPNLP